MNGPRHKLFSRAAFPKHQHRHISGSHLADRIENLLHLPALPEQPSHGGHNLHAGFLQPAVFFFKLRQMKRALEDDLEFSQFDGFLIKIVSAKINGFERVLTLLVAGNHDDFSVHIALKDGLQTAQSLCGPIGIRRQTQIKGDDGGTMFAKKA